jgi:hypothetical protein
MKHSFILREIMILFFAISIKPDKAIIIPYISKFSNDFKLTF